MESSSPKWENIRGGEREGGAGKGRGFPNNWKKQWASHVATFQFELEQNSYLFYTDGWNSCKGLGYEKWYQTLTGYQGGPLKRNQKSFKILL